LNEADMTHAPLLDQINTAAVDPSDMMDAILSLPEQCDRAKQIAAAADLGALAGKRFANVVIAGMGGSAIGGDLLRSIFEPHLELPVTVSRDYHLPGYVGRETLVVAASYSGNTEETLASYDAARKAGASLLAVTTGGELAARAGRDRVPTIAIPGGLQPRAAVGYAFVPLVVAAARLGLMSERLAGDIDEMIAVLTGVRDECNPDVAQTGNRAKTLAAHWAGSIPVIFGSHAERGVVAYRWKTQINENAKAFAAWGVLPELDHNEVVGWSGHGVQARPEHTLSVVFLRDDRESDQIRKRAELTKQIVEKRAAYVTEIWPSGESALARAMSLLYVGDFASCYLAYVYGEDPTPVKIIDWLKAELGRSSRH
jgi:glucose/mannose-6-phosphate isomerase